MPPGTFDTKSEIRFRIKLKSGRVLGPLDLRRIALFIVKNQIVGDELAQEYPQGDWKNIALFPQLADLLLAKLDGRLNKETVRTVEDIVPEAALGETQVIQDETKIIPEESKPSAPTPPVSEFSHTRKLDTNPSIFKSGSLQLQDPEVSKTQIATENKGSGADGEQRVELETRPGVKKGNPKETPEFEEYSNSDVFTSGAKTIAGSGRKKIKKTSESSVSIHLQDGPPESQHFELQAHNPIAERRTEIMDGPPAVLDYIRGLRSRGGGKGGKVSNAAKIRASLIGAVLAWVVYQVYVTEPVKSPMAQLTHIRPHLPSQHGAIDAEHSQQLYLQGVKYYLLDTIEGYTRASEKFLAAATYDPGSVKALAMLASAYLNLVDASNKDETYFSVIAKLIELSRAKSLELAETVIADVEFFIMSNKAEAAENRIIEYTRVQRSFPIDMYYYIAYAFYHRGDYRMAASYLARFPDNKANSPKVFYLRGLLAYQLSTKEEALFELDKAVKLSPSHAKSRLKICEIVAEKGRLIEASPHLQYLIAHPQLMTAKELAKTYFLYGKLKSLLNENEEALVEIERAISLDHGNSEYLLELYTLRAKLGASVSSVRKKARMYFFMGEGEKLLIQGKDQDALSYFLQASEADVTSALPLVRVGDIFVRSSDWPTALLNYRKAFQISRKSVNIGSKYIEALIQNYEWKEVESALSQLRGIPDADSALDKLYGDMYAKQGRNLQAIVWYKKAMSHEVIDPEVYMAFGKSLLATRNFAEAPLFFALALRFDPLNLDAIVGTAQAIAQTDSIERAIRMVQDEIQKARFPRAELYAAVAQFQIQKGDWLSALQSVNQAIEANKDYPLSYKLRAEIYMNEIQSGALKGREEKLKLESALDAYKAYSDRNISDPSGYLDRFRIFAERNRFNEAEEDLLRVFDHFPKYPGLHLLKGNLYLAKGQRDQAFIEYEEELKNNPNYVDGLLAIGKEYIFQGKNDQALQTFERAMKIAPEAAEPKHWAGYANYLLKNYQGAVALYLTAIQIDQGNPVIYKRLGVAYKYLGNEAEAAKAFKRYLELAPDAPDHADFERYQ